MDKYEKIRKKNEKLRRKGRNPSSGWNKLANTSMAGGGPAGFGKFNGPMAFDRQQNLAENGFQDNNNK